jgi:hypothetical protein
LSNFRHPQTNMRYTKGLFLEESYSDKSAVLYTLKDDDHNGYISLYKRYMAMSDPYEINFANTYFDGWEHWQMVCATSWFKPYIERWRKELHLHLKAAALANIKELAADKSSKACFAANKLLLEGAWLDTEEKKGKGRPSKESIKQEAEKLFQERDVILKDFERLAN